MDRNGYIVHLPPETLFANGVGPSTESSLGVEVLVRHWEDGSVTADVRPEGRGVWCPVGITGGTVEKVEV